MSLIEYDFYEKCDRCFGSRHIIVGGLFIASSLSYETGLAIKVGKNPCPFCKDGSKELPKLSLQEEQRND